MNKQDPTEFPWLKFLFSSIFWSIVVMLVLGVMVWYFGRDTQWDMLSGLYDRSSLFSILWKDLLTGLFVLVPCFYAGMFACVALENKGGAYEKQYLSRFRLVSGAVFILILAIWVGLNLLLRKDVTLINGIDAFRLILIFYIFDGNVADGLWEEIFSKRKKTAI